jgi:hypothetical protein
MGVLVTIVAVLGTADRLQAQATATQRDTAIPLEIEVVISRYRADKKTSSVPYLLAVNAAAAPARFETSLNMGADVPVPVVAFTPVPASGEKPAPVRSYNYRSIGTKITAAATPTSDGRFELVLGIDESSVATTGNPGATETLVPDTPVFRSFQTRTTLLLRDGQTRQFTAATDRVSGEVVRVDVTLRISK